MSISNRFTKISSIISSPEAIPEEAPAEPISEGELFVSCYPYQSAEIGDLVFDVGEYITVIKKDGDWWTGTTGNKTGIFPSNYVQPIGSTNASPAADALDAKEPLNNPQDIADEAKNQEEADTEVSEINTQTKAENVQEIYSRPMSTSSTVSVCCKCTKIS